MATNIPDLSREHMSHKRRQSHMVSPQDMNSPILRRMSRLEPRASIQHGPARRMSYATRSSISGFGLGSLKPQMKLANTYRLGPNADEKFNSATVRKIITSVLQSYLEGEKYDRMLCISLSKNLADVIKERMKDQGFSQRYKYVCLVTLGEKSDQGLVLCSRCLWNTDTDNYASASYTKGSLFASATLYAIYFE